jgi:hypothetical protein
MTFVIGHFHNFSWHDIALDLQNLRLINPWVTGFQPFFSMLI